MILNLFSYVYIQVTNMSENNKLGSSGIGGQAVLEGIMMRNKDNKV